MRFSMIPQLLPLVSIDFSAGPYRALQLTNMLLLIRSSMCNMPAWAWLHVSLAAILKSLMLMVLSCLLVGSPSGRVGRVYSSLHNAPSACVKLWTYLRWSARFARLEQLFLEPSYKLSLPMNETQVSRPFSSWAAILCQPGSFNR